MNDISIENYILVRVTDGFPVDHIVSSPMEDHVYSFEHSIFLHSILLEELKKQISDPEVLLKELKKYDVYTENLRDSIHYSLNGIVPSSSYGNFEGRKYIIFEPLMYHINDSLLSLRVENTYFKKKMKLSSNSVIGMTKSDHQELLQKGIDLTGYHIEELPDHYNEKNVSDLLKKLGYESFPLGDHGYVGGLENGRAGQMQQYLSAFAKNNQISQEKHFGSDDFYEELERMEKRSEEIDSAHLKYLLESSGSSLWKEVEPLLEFHNLKMLEPILTSFVSSVGLEWIQAKTQEFNQMMIETRTQERVLK